MIDGSYDPCIVFKPIGTVGGLERYVAELAVTLDAPIYTPTQTVDLPKTTTGDEPKVVEFRERNGAQSILNQLPTGSIGNILEYEQFEVPEHHDLVVTVSETAKSVIHHPHQKRVHLLNMPPRWLFDLGSGRYEHRSPPIRWLMQFYQSLVRVHDVSTSLRIEEFIVPSETIERRLETYYGRTADHIVYPPIDVDRYYFESNGGFLLYLGRLTHIKRVVEIVEALSDTDYRLKVAGTGPQEKAVRKVASRNVEVLGYVSETRKRELLANCDGLVFNSDREAFGIVPIEAMASGKPVVGIEEGFTQHQIRDGVNGVLFSRGSRDLRKAVRRMYGMEWNPQRIQKTAERYDVESFREAWTEVCSDTGQSDQPIT